MIDRGQLKPDAYVVKAQRYTIDKAAELIPWVKDPTKVSDVIFQVGLNDHRRGLTPEEIQDKTLELQMKYNEKFPNAREHLTLIPPLDSNHSVNVAIQKLASYTKSNLISTKSFIDKRSGKM